MAKLNQIVAVVNGKKTETKKELTQIHRRSSASDSFVGLTRSYQPLSEDDETFPDENKSVRYTARECLNDLETTLTNLLDVVATQDVANTQATANVVVDNKVVLENVPVTYLMFLEKQLVDIQTFVGELPVLDQAETWHLNDNQGLYESEPYSTNKTKKSVRHKVLYEATKEHPAQIETWNEDVKVGTWTTKKFSGALSQVDKNNLLNRVKLLQQAVKFAREEANNIDVQNIEYGKNIFSYLLK